LNEEYAKRGRFFSSSEGIRLAAEAITHADLRQFFTDYMVGTREIPWDEFLARVGLCLEQRSQIITDAGFTVTHNFDEPPAVKEVAPNSAAERAGLTMGDLILEINGKIAFPDMEQRLAAMKPGDAVQLKIHNRRGDRELQWKMAGSKQETYEIKNTVTVTPEQKAHRASWLSTDWSQPTLLQLDSTHATGDHHP